MAITTYIPGMAPGRTLANTIVFGLYLILFPLIPFVFAHAVLTNRNRIADRLVMSGAPGMTLGGGAKPAAVTFVVLLVAISLIAALSIAPFFMIADSEGPGTSSVDDNHAADSEPPDEATGDGGESDGADGENTAESSDADPEDDADETPFMGDDEDTDKWEDELTDEEQEVINSIDYLEELLIRDGFEVTKAEMGDDVIHIEYRTYAEDNKELSREVGQFAGIYATYDDIREGDTERMYVTVLDPNDVEQGTYYVEGDWAREVYNDEITTEEYINRVSDTITVPDHFDNDGDNGNSSDDEATNGEGGE